MHRPAAALLMLLGAAACGIGLVGATIFQLQPWRSCPYEDSPAGCAMLHADYNAFLVFVVVLLAGIILLITAGAIRLSRR